MTDLHSGASTPLCTWASCVQECSAVCSWLMMASLSLRMRLCLSSLSCCCRWTFLQASHTCSSSRVLPRTSISRLWCTDAQPVMRWLRWQSEWCAFLCACVLLLWLSPRCWPGHSAVSPSLSPSLWAAAEADEPPPLSPPHSGTSHPLLAANWP